MSDAANNAAIRRLVEEVKKSVTPQYRLRVRSYGPNAARALLDLFEKLEKELED